MTRWTTDFNVDKAAPHFCLLYGENAAQGKDKPQVSAACVGFLPGGDFAVEFNSAALQSPDIQKAVIRELDYFLVELPAVQGKASSPEDIWDYLIYHSTQTAANLYGTVHWQYEKAVQT